MFVRYEIRFVAGPPPLAGLDGRCLLISLTRRSQVTVEVKRTHFESRCKCRQEAIHTYIYNMHMYVYIYVLLHEEDGAI